MGRGRELEVVCNEMISTYRILGNSDTTVFSFICTSALAKRTKPRATA